MPNKMPATLSSMDALTCNSPRGLEIGFMRDKYIGGMTVVCFRPHSDLAEQFEVTALTSRRRGEDVEGRRTFEGAGRTAAVAQERGEFVDEGTQTVWRRSCQHRVFTFPPKFTKTQTRKRPRIRRIFDLVKQAYERPVTYS